MPADRPIAVVTGANRGIGRDVTRQLAAAGFAVLLGSRDLADGQAAARQIDPDGHSVTAGQLDVTDPASVTAFASFATEHFGRADVLVNNAAIHYDTWQHAADADLAIVDEALATNLLGAWRTTIALLPLLRRSRHPTDRQRLQRGRIDLRDDRRNPRLQRRQGWP